MGINDKNIVSVKTDGTLKISVGSKLFQKIREAHTWYTSKAVSIPAVVFFFVIDVLGFGQIMRLTLKESVINQTIIISALAVAFEIAPLYIGYALCLKSYGLGKPIHKWVLLFSTMACVLGIFGNTFFRVFTMKTAYMNPVTGEMDSTALPLTVLMSLLPIITSLVNLTIGCLSFDPLLFDLLRVSKKLQKLKIREQQIMAYLAEFEGEDRIKSELEQDEEECYKRVKNEIQVLRMKLKTYVITRTSFE